jgi:hypothetical protein
MVKYSICLLLFVLASCGGDDDGPDYSHVNGNDPMPPESACDGAWQVGYADTHVDSHIEIWGGSLTTTHAHDVWVCTPRNKLNPFKEKYE